MYNDIFRSQNSLLLSEGLGEGGGELVGAWSWLGAAGDAFEGGDYLSGGAAYGESAHSEGVAGTAAGKINVGYDAVAVDIYIDRARASAGGSVMVSHDCWKKGGG